jgi:Raf kinase inhibitor-like YbhB/YbcL family protein
MNDQTIARPVFVLLIVIFTAGISRSQTAGNFKLVSPAFQDGKQIPSQYTCDSINISPPLKWSGFPEKTKSFAIVMDDPDAPMGNWVHWVIYNIPATVTSVEEKKAVSQINAVEGLNSWNEKGYNGPCPTDGTHQYNFIIYALDRTISPKEGMTNTELFEAMKGHILGEARLSGFFRIE